MNDTPTSTSGRSGSLLMGFVWILLGLFLISNPVWASVAVTKLTGWTFLIGGGVAFLGALMNRVDGNRWWPLIAGLIMMFVGYDLLTNSLRGTITLTFLVVVWLLFEGVLGSIAAIAMRRTVDAWGIALTSSVITLLLGVALWNKFPSDAAWLLGTYAGIAMMLRGMVSIMLRGVPKAVPSDAA